jgi:predicted dehydrogenase
MFTPDSHMNRRHALRGIGAIAVGGALAPSALLDAAPQEHATPVPRTRPFTGKPVTCIILGAGSRGNTYAAWSQQFPGHMKVVGVAEPIPSRQEKFAALYNIPPEHRFTSWDNALDKPKFADAILITMPDQLHHGAAMRGLELGYDMLLEKPIATSWKHCEEILGQHRKYPRIVAVCHVLRYTAYYRKLQSIVASGILGEVVTIEHLEPVGYWHQGHSFVRGNWRNVATSCPMILAKSCHDLDILRWLMDVPCTSVASYGSLKHFKPENAPAGSTARCTGGCTVEPECPYSALKLYLDMKNNGWPVSVITEDTTYEGRMKAMREGPYGRCVYHSDNDVVDHQVLSLEFARERTASFTMTAFTTGSRRTRVMGTMGEATGDSRYITVANFRTGKQETIDTSLSETGITSGHGGGDNGLMEAFIKATQHQDPSIIASSLEVSMESHRIAFEAERSRLEKRTVIL